MNKISSAHDCLKKVVGLGLSKDEFSDTQAHEIQVRKSQRLQDKITRRENIAQPQTLAGGGS